MRFGLNWRGVGVICAQTRISPKLHRVSSGGTWKEIQIMHGRWPENRVSDWASVARPFTITGRAAEKAEWLGGNDMGSGPLVSIARPQRRAQVTPMASLESLAQSAALTASAVIAVTQHVVTR